MNNKGFTLVELVVSMLLYSLILVIFTTAVLAFSRMYELATKLNDVSNDAEVIYNVIDKAYKESETFFVTGNQITIDGTEYYFDRVKRTFNMNDIELFYNKDIVNMFIYDYSNVNNLNYYEFRVVYYLGGELQELYFILSNF